MWIWPLDSVVGVTTAHRAPERVADGTCTRVWAWMTDKCRRRMNEREGYITTEITQSGTKGREGPEKGERLLGCERSWEFPSSGEVSFSLGRWAVRFCVFFTPKTSRRLIRAQLLDHSLQIHCNGPGSKTKTLQLAPSVGKLLVQWWVQ